MFRITLLVGLFAAACSPASPSQTISGRVDPSGFPTPVDAVRIVQGNTEIAAAPVAGDGTFTVAVPKGAGYRFEFVSLEEPTLIFPRQSGAIDASFTILSGTQPFDLGVVRFIGDPASHSYHQGASGEVADGECENGIDENGAICVDDDGGQDSGCEDGTNDGETNDDGTDPGDGDGETNDDAPPQQAAVADHNLPSSMGCDDQADGEEAD